MKQLDIEEVGADGWIVRANNPAGATEKQRQPPARLFKRNEFWSLITYVQAFLDPGPQRVVIRPLAGTGDSDG